MSFKLLVSILGSSALFGAMLAGGAMAAEPDLRWIVCPSDIAPAADLVDLVIDIERVEISSAEDDSGSSFEIRLGFGAMVYARDNAGKPIGPKLCGELAPDWEFDLPIMNIKTGPMQAYPVQKRLIIYNVPRGSVVMANAAIWELDDTSGDDNGDLSPGDDLAGMHLWLYPDIGKGIVQPDKATTFNLQFGKSKRVVGDNKGKWSDFTAGLEFTVTVSEHAPITGTAPKVGGVAPKVGGAIGGGLTVSPNLPSPGTPLQPAPVPVTAEPLCRDYAIKAVEMNVEAQKLGCGYPPPVWSNDHQMHFDWCMQGANSTVAPSQNVQRAADLQACAAQKATQPAANLGLCAIYAAEATAAAVKASALGCGFSGPRWSADYAGHLGWCAAGANPLVMVAETASRAGELAACAAANGGN